jgi:hypothetical protein
MKETYLPVGKDIFKASGGMPGVTKTTTRCSPLYRIVKGNGE